MRIVEIIMIRPGEEEIINPAISGHSRFDAKSEYEALMALVHNAFMPDGQAKRLWYLGPDPVNPSFVSPEEQEQAEREEPTTLDQFGNPQ